MHIKLLQKVKPILVKAVAEGELDAIEAGKIETSLNKCCRFPALSLNEKQASFLLKKMRLA